MQSIEGDPKSTQRAEGHLPMTNTYYNNIFNDLNINTLRVVRKSNSLNCNGLPVHGRNKTKCIHGKTGPHLGNM